MTGLEEFIVAIVGQIITLVAVVLNYQRISQTLREMVEHDRWEREFANGHGTPSIRSQKGQRSIGSP